MKKPTKTDKHRSQRVNPIPTSCKSCMYETNPLDSPHCNDCLEIVYTRKHYKRKTQRHEEENRPT